MRRVSTLILLVLVPLLLCAASTSFTGKCVGVTDGDTISVLKDGKAVKVRLDGIDCPESGQDFGSRAKQFTSDMVFGKTVEVRQTDVDRYGRTVARIIIDKHDLSLELVQVGLAWHYKQYSNDTTLAIAERQAHEAKRGLWSQPDPIPPWQFRHGDMRTSNQTGQPSDTVYVTASGKKYHKDGCRYLTKSKRSLTIAEAQAQGYTPCKVCFDNTGQAKEQKSTDKNSDITVYITRTGTKYHRPGCSYLKRSAIPISKKEAIKRGYSPCSRCKP